MCGGLMQMLFHLIGTSYQSILSCWSSGTNPLWMLRDSFKIWSVIGRPGQARRADWVIGKLGRFFHLCTLVTDLCHWVSEKAWENIPEGLELTCVAPQGWLTFSGFLMWIPMWGVLCTRLMSEVGFAHLQNLSVWCWAVFLFCSAHLGGHSIPLWKSLKVKVFRTLWN